MVVNPYTFDNTDDQTNFVGFHLTHPLINADNHFAVFAYYLNRDSDTQAAFKSGVTNFDPDSKAGKTDRVTVGGRTWGKLPANFDYDLEGGPQFGQLAGNDIRAAISPANWAIPCPQSGASLRLSAGYDYASGDHRRDGQSGTFDQLFPTGHIQFGSLDFVGRQNVSTPNVALTVNPTPELKLWTSCCATTGWPTHMTRCTTPPERPSASTPPGPPARTSATNGTSTAPISWVRHTTLMVGYGIFLPGDFIRNTGKSEIAQMLYSSIEFKF